MATIADATESVDTDGNVDIYAGASYVEDSDRDRRLLFTNSGGTWATLRNSTVEFRARFDTVGTAVAAGNVETLTVEGEVISGHADTGSEQRLTFPLTAAETADLKVGEWLFQIWAVLKTTKKSSVLLQTGEMTVMDDLSNGTDT